MNQQPLLGDHLVKPTANMRKAAKNHARESSLKIAVMKELRAVPGLCVRKRWGGPQSTLGDPDLSGCYKGRHFEIELKQIGEQATPLQRERLAEWARAGALCGVAHTVEEAFKILGIPRGGGAGK